MKNTSEVDLSLINKTAVITGASSGVGLATAQLFAKNGYQIILAARGEEGLQKATDQCRNLGATAFYKATDMGSAEDVKSLVDYTLEKFGRIDVWVNNAGVMASGKFEEIPMYINEQVIINSHTIYFHMA